MAGIQHKLFVWEAVPENTSRRMRSECVNVKELIRTAADLPWQATAARGAVTPSGHELEQTLGNGEGQGSLACCSPWGRKESDMIERLNKNNTSSY